MGEGMAKYITGRSGLTGAIVDITGRNSVENWLTFINIKAHK